MVTYSTLEEIKKDAQTNPSSNSLLTSSLKKYVFYNCLINNVLYLRVT